LADKKITKNQRDDLQSLCHLISSWRSSSLSHKHRFKGVELYESMSNMKTFIKELRGHADHKALQQLEKGLTNSLVGLDSTYESLKQGQAILSQVSDILYGTKDEKGKRDTAAYKLQSTSQQVEQKLKQLLEQNQEIDKVHCDETRDYLQHFAKTFNGWKTHLFTCYDHPAMPNDNNRLELSHSQIKKQRRRITGQSSTSKFLKNWGEQAAFALELSYETNVSEILTEILRQIDYGLLKKEKQRQQQKSKMRGITITTKKRLAKSLQQIKESWFKNPPDKR